MPTLKGSGLSLYLIGFMGSGKSTVGRLLAELLGTDFVDLDPLVEEKAKKSIEEIFALEGEKRFRELESEVLAEVAGRKAVVATGGGIIQREENIRLMRETGTVVWLRISYREFERRREKLAGRPLLSSPESKVKKLFEGRTKLYRKASHICVNVDQKTPEEVAQEVLRCLSSS